VLLWCVVKTTYLSKTRAISVATGPPTQLRPKRGAGNFSTACLYSGEPTDSSRTTTSAPSFCNLLARSSKSGLED